MHDWMELMMKDHGVLQPKHNLHQIDTDMWRSNQPTPARMDYAQASHHQSAWPHDDGGWQLAEACAACGIELVDAARV